MENNRYRSCCLQEGFVAFIGFLQLVLWRGWLLRVPKTNEKGTLMTSYSHPGEENAIVKTHLIIECANNYLRSLI